MGDGIPQGAGDESQDDKDEDQDAVDEDNNGNEEPKIKKKNYKVLIIFTKLIHTSTLSSFSFQ